jgi:G:T-mismatch repair DNA endonuclease (very short patch repair protein)
MKAGTYHHTEEAKRKISASKVGKRRPPLSAEHRQKLREANLGRKIHFTEEHKRKLSDALKRRWSEDTNFIIRCTEGRRGQLSPWWGKHHTPETKSRISEALRGCVGSMTGRRHTPETRAKIGAAQVGRHPSPETRRKMSENQRGELSHSGMQGKRHSPEAREKQRQAALLRSPTPLAEAERKRKIGEAMRGERNPFFGRHHSDATRAKLSTNRKASWQNPEYREHIVRAVLAANQVRPTTPERTMQSILDRNFPGEWKYTGNGEVIIGGKNPDFVNINGRKAVIEVFGNYWHSERITGKPPDQDVADRIAHFAKYGFRCTVIWEREASDENLVLTKLGEST